jgi:hypothetical protein
VADPLDRLYAASLDDFVPVRNEVAKELKAAGETERAAEVAKLRKPSVVLWALNQGARKDKKAARALAKAAGKVADVQARRAKGDLRGEQERLREVSGTLVESAEGALRDAGRTVSETTGHRLHELLRAVAADPGSREALASGQLAEEPELGGFSALGALGTAKVQKPQPASATEPKQPTRAELAREKREAEREEKRQELRAELREAEATATEARRAADRAERQVAQLRRSLERLEG